MDITIEPLTAPEIRASCELVERVFRKHVAPLFSDEGVNEFMKYCTVETMTERMERGNVMIAARSAGPIVGFLEIRDFSHIALFFVDTTFHRTGIGRKLFDTILPIVKERNPNLNELTVNASPNSIYFYKHLGFEPTGDETTTNGIRYIPMACPMSF